MQVAANRAVGSFGIIVGGRTREPTPGRDTSLIPYKAGDTHRRRPGSGIGRDAVRLAATDHASSPESTSTRFHRDRSQCVADASGMAMRVGHADTSSTG